MHEAQTGLLRRRSDLFEVTFDADSIATTSIPVPQKPADLSFWGAGSSTFVPLVPPEPK